ncbi:MAG TPA: cupredoxin family copper-binding protein [Acidimicrobiales bacterium]|nr:cupredoxin family copper-binding protein [Acidimicrobiales bacterium]
MISNPMHRRIAVATFVLVAFGAGACSDSDSKSASPSTPSTSESADSARPAAGAGDTVAIKDFNYQPGDLKVAKGTKVTFTNEDGFAHTVTAKDKSFDSDKIDAKGTFEHTFDEAGAFPYLCAIHNSMTGTITVS